MGPKGPAHPKMVAWPLALYGIAAGLYAGMPGGNWSWFSYHPFSMMVSMFSLSASAAIVKKRGGYENTKLHGTLMLVATLLAGFGWYVIYSNKEILGKAHLTSWHAWIGLACLVAYIKLFLVGLAGLHPDFGIKKTNKSLRFAHKWGGRAATGLAWISAIVGFNNMHSNQPLLQFAFAAPLTIASYFVLL